jgi:hypothetical protein|tara:strand:+ start:157 stop:615 length:459 start_codon:yes stop_codon:yes gene_type:complete
MLADVVNQLRGYIASLPVYEKEVEGEFLDEEEQVPVVSKVKVDMSGKFVIAKGATDASVAYQGHLIASETGKGLDQGEVDNGYYRDIQDIVGQVRQKAVELAGENYEVRGLTYNSSDVWFTLERCLMLPGELPEERADIQATFPKCTETYEP